MWSMVLLIRDGLTLEESGLGWLSRLGCSSRLRVGDSSVEGVGLVGDVWWVVVEERRLKREICLDIRNIYVGIRSIIF